MDKSLSENASTLARDYIAFATMGLDAASDELTVRSWELDWAVDDEPAFAWAVIKLVVLAFPAEELLTNKETLAKSVVGLLAAGPIEDLLSQHGADFIAEVEELARADRRMQWALGGVWQLTMTDEFYARVQRAAGEFSTLKQKSAGE